MGCVPSTIDNDTKKTNESVADGNIITNIEPIIKSNKGALVLYASESGTSEGFARDMAKKLPISTRLICMNQTSSKELLKEERIFVIASTYGEGEAPSNGQNLYFDLLECRENGCKFDNLTFSVLALGSSKHVDLCNFGRNFDKLLHELGGSRIEEVQLADKMADLRQMDVYKAWFKRMKKWVKMKEYGLNGDYNEEEENDEDEESLAKNFKLSYKSVENDEPQLIYALEKVHNRSIASCRVISVTKLQSPSSEKQTILVKLLIPTSIQHKPGDHAVILPPNPHDEVERLMSFISDPPNKHFNIEEMIRGKWIEQDRLPSCSLQRALTWYLDIMATPSKEFLLSLKQFAKHDEDRELIGIWTDVGELEWRSGAPTLADTLSFLKSVKVPTAWLLSVLPLQSHRSYSVSNSSSVNPNEMHIMAAVVEYEAGGKVRNGLCSGWMSTLQPGDMVPAGHRSMASFHLPKNPKEPVIMVGAGAGLSPFRSFWQERYCNREEAGPSLLFFGCRNPDYDDLVRDERQDLEDKGIIENITAYSRHGPKMYVQDAIKLHQDRLYDLLINQKAHIYICGDASVASGVRKAILEIFMDKMAISDAEAKKFIRKMRSENRVHEDVNNIKHANNALIIK
ncbi:DgyrCDS2962 [Dimorphilus gyrociliatus]|uniref:DgyrCDS2962 n=1 Tax=Dimorphilus gyrociliatus TaxID=2664684 RepID=A0A7I8VBS2_9ANNE|nr:DgyrCDS2962 [Dimorphilus gyrociliatus]